MAHSLCTSMCALISTFFLSLYVSIELHQFMDYDRKGDTSGYPSLSEAKNLVYED